MSEPATAQRQVARYLAPGGEGPRLGLLSAAEPEVIADAGPAPAAGFVPTPQAWEALAPTGVRHDAAAVTFLTPVQPRKVLAIGLNYRDHAREGGVELPVAPMVFAKLTSALVGHGAAVIAPAHESQVDWEAELALVIGRRAKDVGDPAEALGYIGGYTAANDVSGREAQLGDGQVVRGKGFDTFGPIGPAIHPVGGVDLQRLDVTCVVSGETMQSASTAEMVFGAGELVSYLSLQCTLEPGDVILTGTPAGTGIGQKPPRFLRDGDVMEVTVGAVGPLRNRVELAR